MFCPRRVLPLLTLRSRFLVQPPRPFILRLGPFVDSFLVQPFFSCGQISLSLPPFLLHGRATLSLMHPLHVARWTPDPQLPDFSK